MGFGALPGRTPCARGEAHTATGWSRVVIVTLQICGKAQSHSAMEAIGGL
jgi:hypothetical protein